MALIDKTKRILADLVAFPTVSTDSNLALIAYAADRLGACGATIKIMRDETGQKANLFATIGPEQDGGVVLCGHTDVVPAEEQDWLSSPFTTREADGRIYGRGTCDMKGFIAAALAVAPHFARQQLVRPVHFALTYDEEIGCLGARRLVEELGQLPFAPDIAIAGEPTGMRPVEGHKGCFEYTTVFTGLKGHGSQPDAGVNAVEYAIRYAARLMELAERLKSNPANAGFDPPWTTLQVGRVDGGIARNVIAGHCMLEWEMRPVRGGDVDEVKTAMNAYCETVLLPAMRAIHPAAAIETEIVGEVRGLEPTTDNEARRLVAALTGAANAELVSFGTEAGLYQALGISTVVCGPGSIAQAHRPDEFVDIAQLQACLDMLTGLAHKLSRKTTGRRGFA